MGLFDEAARKRIEAAIGEVERQTAGEVVVVSVPRSDDYHEVRLLYGVALALAGAGISHVVWPSLSITWLLWLQAALVALGWLALSLPGLLRALVPRALAQACVQRRARLEFLEHRIYDTRDHTGVLILLSELEHRVVMLGDKGIYDQLHEDGFQSYVNRIVTAVRTGKPADGVCEVVADLGKLLAQNFPPRADDTNELSNAVRQE